MVSASIVGAIMGLGVQFYVNAVRKLPLMQNPWEHAIAAGAGAALGAWVVDFEKRTEKELTEMLHERAAAEAAHQEALRK